MAAKPKPPTPISHGEPEIPLDLEEFCMRLSRRDRRVELIAAFHHHMRHQAGVTFATESVFIKHFRRFIGD